MSNSTSSIGIHTSTIWFDCDLNTTLHSACILRGRVSMSSSLLKELCTAMYHYFYADEVGNAIEYRESTNRHIPPVILSIKVSVNVIGFQIE